MRTRIFPALVILATLSLVLSSASLSSASLSDAAQTTITVNPGDSVTIAGCTTSLNLSQALLQCAPAPTPTVVPTPLPVPQRTLLGSWATDSPNFVDLSEPVYKPRGYVDGLINQDETNGPQIVYPSAGYGNGFDYLHLPDRGILRTLTDPNLYQINTTRAAKIVVVLRTPNVIPAWLTNSGFINAGLTGDFWCGNSVQCFAYTKDVATASTVNLGGPSSNGEEENMYYVLLAEAGGIPSIAPVQRGSPEALSNTTCPDWVHAQYITTGHDGKIYPTWHPQIDPVYWCSFGHEHGSDPALMGVSGFEPAYGYAGQAMGMTEAHPGFKSYHVITGDQEWFFTQHFQTASIAGVCNPDHELQIAEKTVVTNVLNVNLNLVGDFGFSKDNQSLTRLSPPACPNQGVGSNSEGERLFVVNTDPGGPTFYEPWRTGSMGSVLGLSGAITFNTLDPGVACDSLNCQMVSTGLSGSHRYVQPNRNFGVTAGASDNFCSDPMGNTILTCGPTSSVKQFIKLGINITWNYQTDNFFIDNVEGNCFTNDYQFVDIHVSGGHVCNLEKGLNPFGLQN